MASLELPSPGGGPGAGDNNQVQNPEEQGATPPAETQPDEPATSPRDRLDGNSPSNQQPVTTDPTGGDSGAGTGPVGGGPDLRGPSDEPDYSGVPEDTNAGNQSDPVFDGRNQGPVNTSPTGRDDTQQTPPTNTPDTDPETQPEPNPNPNPNPNPGGDETETPPTTPPQSGQGQTDDGFGAVGLVVAAVVAAVVALGGAA